MRSGGLVLAKGFALHRQLGASETSEAKEGDYEGSDSRGWSRNTPR